MVFPCLNTCQEGMGWERNSETRCCISSDIFSLTPLGKKKLPGAKKLPEIIMGPRCFILSSAFLSRYLMAKL